MDKIILFQDGLTLLLDTYFIETRFFIVLPLVFAAAVFDVRSLRIPNWLVFGGAILGILYSSISAYGMGAMSSLGGLAVGLAAFMPLYMLRAMGAGDVKLMGMVGSFLGPTSTFGAVLTVFVVGGVLAIAAAIRNRAVQTLVDNSRFILTDITFKVMNGSAIRVDPPPASAGKLPYALAIAAGTITHVFLLKSGHALIS